MPEPKLSKRLILGVFSLVAVALFGCAAWKEYSTSCKYPAGGGVLLNRNGEPITVVYPTPTPPANSQNNMR